VVEGLETIRRLWRGESVQVQDGLGQEASVASFPRPQQIELPIWLTASGNPDTFELAAANGCKVLTAALSLNMSQLFDRIGAYWRAWERYQANRPGGGVTVMLHTFVAHDAETAHAAVRQPFIEYLRSHSELARSLLVSTGCSAELSLLSQDDIDGLLEAAFERYFQSQSLMGSFDKCALVSADLAAAGVTEIACLVDFGLPLKRVLESLGLVALLREGGQPMRSTGG
jgi:natural product biosynthesis luciferase-like monooxygenase protein